MLTGCGVQQQSDFTMWVGDASLTWVPAKSFAGSHEFKVGYQLSARDITGNADITPQGNYALMFDMVNNVRQGVQFETSNAPVFPANWDNVHSAYVTDQWRVGQRLTFNIGVPPVRGPSRPHSHVSKSAPGRASRRGRRLRGISLAAAKLSSRPRTAGSTRRRRSRPTITS